MQADVIARQAHHLGEVLEDLDAGLHHGDVFRFLELGTDALHGRGCRQGGQRVALLQHQGLQPISRSVEGGGSPHDATADDHHVGCGGEVPRVWNGDSAHPALSWSRGDSFELRRCTAMKENPKGL